MIPVYVILGLLVVAALWTVQASILRAVIGLALVSVLLSVLMFQMGAPLAGVFELSVCAGLITVVFVSTISLTRPLSAEEAREDAALRARRFRPAAVVAAGVGAILWVASYGLDVSPAIAQPVETVSEVLWSERRLDLLGQIVVVFVGVFAVVILFKQAADRKEVPER